MTPGQTSPEASARAQRPARPATRQRASVGIALADETEPESNAQTSHGQTSTANPPRAGQGATSPVIALWGEQEKSAMAQPQAADAATPQPLPPGMEMLSKDATSLFNTKASLGDLLSVMKFTWRMARRK